MLRFPAKIAIGALIAAVAFGVSIAGGFGSTTVERPAVHAAREGQFRDVRVTEAAAAGGTKIAYVYGNETAPAGQFAGGFLTCPKKFPHPISGFFDSSSNDTYLSASRPTPFGVSAKAARKWAIGVTNTGTQSAGVVAGVVCAQ